MAAPTLDGAQPETHVDPEAQKEAAKRNRATQQLEHANAKPPTRSRPPKQVDATQPAHNTKAGRAMKATHEDVVRTTPEGVEMETDTHLLIIVPNKNSEIQKFKRKGYELVVGHEINDDDQVVMQIEKSVKAQRYLDATAKIRQFQNDEVDTEAAGVHMTGKGLNGMTVGQALDRADENNFTSAYDEVENG